MTQNSSSPKNYNFPALRGANITDQEYVETFGIPEEYANTPKMIEWHVQDMREGNQRVYEKKGMDPAEIQSKLTDITQQQKKDVIGRVKKEGYEIRPGVRIPLQYYAH